MSKIYTLLFITVLIIFGGCEANHAPTEAQDDRVVSDANVSINENDLLKTNDTTPAFSGEYFNINKTIGISLSIGGATYKIYPLEESKWSLDTEVPNTVVAGDSGATITKLTSGVLNLLTDGTYDIKIEVEDLNGTVYKINKQIIIDTTTDASVEVTNIERRIDRKPKFTGTSSNVYESIKLSLDGVSYDIAPNADGSWELDTQIQKPSTGTLNLVDGNIYKVLIDAVDVDDNSIDQISFDFNPGLLNITSAVYKNNNTDSTSDDYLFVYFNKFIDTSSAQGSPNLYIDIEGTGSIGTDSTGYAWHNIFDTYRISLSNNSIEFDVASTKVSLTPGGITDSSGNEAVENNKKINIEKFNSLGRLATGNTICVDSSNTLIDCSDNLAIKSDASYLLDNASRVDTNTSDIIYYYNTGLFWQKDDDNTQKTHSDAKSYCENLNLGSRDNWKVPSMAELTSIVKFGTNNPAINDYYSSTKNSIYWSDDVYIENTNKYWGINFQTGKNASENNTNLHYVRCVSLRE